jgi:transcriptional regulator with XRE-family HTH domain
MNGVGEKIKNRRIQLDLSLQQVAEFVGVTRTTVMRWEKGIIENMRRDKIQKLADILLVSPLYILGLSNDIEEVRIALLKKTLNQKINNLDYEGLNKLNSMIDLMFKK